LRKINIAIDGYAACGKSTTARLSAKALDYIYIDSGAMYRAFTLYLLENEINLTNITEVIKQLSNVEIRFDRQPETCSQEILLNGQFVEKKIRSIEVSNTVSLVSTIKEVRNWMVHRQQALGKEKGIVMDGRDIGTIVFPEAELKIFMNAQTDTRVQRRVAELISSNIPFSVEAVEKNLKERDFLDTTRNESPLVQAVDARMLDTSFLTIQEQVETVVEWAQELINMQE